MFIEKEPEDSFSKNIEQLRMRVIEMIDDKK
jgi:hypothetical protein